jgi:hypothetical protein
MDPLQPDPHNHAPSVSADDEWVDGYGTAQDLPEFRPVLPPKRAVPAPDPAPTRSRSRPEMGIQIDVARPARRPPADDSPPPASAPGHDVVKLEAILTETSFQARNAIVPPLKPAAEAPQNLRGESTEWGKVSKTPTRWLVTAAGGVVLLVVLAMVTQEVWLKDPKAAVGAVVEAPEDAPLEEVAGFELDSSSEADARKLLATYATATTVEEVLPLIRSGQALADRLKLDWRPWRLAPDWQPPVLAIWEVSAEGGRSRGLLRGNRPDLSRFRAYFVREDDALKLDWEATEGLSDASFETLLKGMGTGGILRAYVKLDHYYTQVLPEDTYHSFLLLAPDRKQSVCGYSKMGTPADAALMKIFNPSVIDGEAKSELPITLRLEPGPENCQKNQWLIGEMLHIDWVSP